MSSFFPVLSAVHAHDPARVRRLVQRAAELMTVISLPILAVTIALSDQIVDLLYGDQFARTADVLPVLMIAFVSICFGSLAGFLAPLLNLHWRLALYSGVGAIANIGLNVWLIPQATARSAPRGSTVVTEVLTMTLMLGTALWTLRLRVKPWRLLATVAVARRDDGGDGAGGAARPVPGGDRRRAAVRRRAVRAARDPRRRAARAAQPSAP